MLVGGDSDELDDVPIEIVNLARLPGWNKQTFSPHMTQGVNGDKFGGFDRSLKD
jgi:hypothetical protein